MDKDHSNISNDRTKWTLEVAESLPISSTGAFTYKFTLENNAVTLLEFQPNQ